MENGARQKQQTFPSSLLALELNMTPVSLFQKSSRKKEKEKQTCKGCNESFNFTKRKHHCKSCGAVSTDGGGWVGWRGLDEEKSEPEWKHSFGQLTTGN